MEITNRSAPYTVYRVPHSDVRLVFLHSLHRMKFTRVILYEQSKNVTRIYVKLNLIMSSTKKSAVTCGYSSLPLWCSRRDVFTLGGQILSLKVQGQSFLKSSDFAKIQQKTNKQS